MNLRVRVTFLLLFISIITLNKKCEAQKRTWKVLENSPTATTRFNDCTFINPMTGWVCSSDNGNIHKTTNGGYSWFVVGSTSLLGNRSIVFADSLNGFTGEYSSNNRISRTSDGGKEWSDLIIPSPPGYSGICGWWVVNPNVIYGCGRYWGPLFFVKTTNGGLGWQSKNMIGYANGLVDCYFPSEDTGFVVGRASLFRPIVLRTMNGGTDWDTMYHGDSISGWCWKISFPDRLNGYVSIESESDTTKFLKTTDGGNTWEIKTFLQSEYDEEGIGFVNASTGWIGGWDPFTYETTDCGTSWHLLDTVPGTIYNINRFRFFGDSVGYAIGKRVYKYMDWSMTNTDENPKFTVSDFNLYQNYPNPFNPRTRIKFSINKAGNVNLDIYNTLGKVVSKILEDKYLPAGTHEFDWDATMYSSGIYYYKLRSNDFETTKFMMLVK